jgi:rod shape-determining protein MreC
MKDFFGSLRFRILAAVLIVVFAFMVRAAQNGAVVPMLSRIVGFFRTPGQRVGAQAAYSVGETVNARVTAPRIAQENQDLREQLAELREQMIDYETYKTENNQLREYLEIKENNPDFHFEPAIVIGRDAADRFYSFTIDKGSKDGISADDPVITSEGLVGIVSSVGLTHAKVVTILDATVQVGVMDIKTREIGATSGNIELSQQEKLRFSYLPRDSAAQPDDIVTTTGIGGIYPRDLIVGVIEQIVPDPQGLSLYAVVRPMADIHTVHDVLVITQFEGQSSGEQE